MNRYLKAVLDAHELIQSWLSCSETPDAICETLLTRFGSNFSMITATGIVLDINALNTFFRTQRGARQGLKIEITDMSIISESTNGAIVIYKEFQQQPKQALNIRFATAIFEINPNGHVEWRYLQETFLV